MRIDLNNLPTDPILLQRLDRDLADHVDNQQQKYQEQANRINQLEHQLAVLRHQRFGRSSEKVPAEQRAFWDTKHIADIAGVEQALSNEKTESSSTSTNASDNLSNSSKPKCQLPNHLPREHHTHSLEQCTSCGGTLQDFGDEVVEQLDY